MAAVISGSGLGLFDASLNRLGGTQVGQGGDRQYVNIATGNLILQSQDEQLLFRGLPVAQLRTYNSLGLVSQTGTDGWLTGFERRIELLSGTFNTAGSVMRRHTGDGAYQDFTWISDGEYQSTAGDGAHDNLTWASVDSTWHYTEGSSRRKERYADHADPILQGRLDRIKEKKSDGTDPAIWDVLYDANGRIDRIEALDGTGTGDALVFGYNAAGQLASVSTRENGAVKGQVTYGYENADGSGRLIWVQTDLTPDNTADNTWDATTAANNDGKRFRTSYTYDGSSLRIASAAQSDGTVASYTYYADGKIKTVTQGDTNTNDADGAGETLTYTYAAGSATVTDSLNRAWVYAYDANNQLTSVTAPAVAGQSDITTYAYDSAGNVTQARTVRGAQTLKLSDYRYDSQGNQTGQWEAVQGTSATTITRTYSSTNQLLTETRHTGLDADGPGSGLPTGGLTTQYIYDAQDRLRFVVDAAGQVSQITYATSGNGTGQQASVRQYLGSTYSDAATESALSSWATAQQGGSTLTEYSYDLWGRLAQRTDYASVNATTGAGVFDAAAAITRYTYDAQGLLRQQITVRGAGRTLTGAAPTGSQTIDYVYDGMGRLLSVLSRDAVAASTDVNTVATTYAYIDSAHQLAVTTDAGATRIETRNAAGRLLSAVDSGTVSGATVTRTTENFFDSAGQLRATRDANGAISYFFYDEKGRLEAVVDSTGAVTQTTYDGADRIVQMRQYANRVTTTTWLSGATVNMARFADIGVVASDTQDRVQASTYDSAGRLATQTDALASSAERSITTYSYDGANRLTQVKVTDAVGTAATARITRQFHDAAGRVVGVLDAEGYLTETAFDAAGRPVTVTRYATVSPSAFWATGTLAQLRPAANAANDQVTRSYYDGRGQLVGTLDAEGYLTEAVFDEALNVRAERRYPTRLTWASGDTLATLRGRAGVPRESRMAYNGLGQLVTRTNPEGTVTRWTYDEAGRLVRTTTADGVPTEVRDDYRRYNVFGELIGQISGEGAVKASVLLGGKALNDPTLTEAQRDQAYSTYGMRHSVDALGRRIESIDAEGNKTWYFYDNASRQTFVVHGVAEDNAGVSGVLNRYGEVTETRYDAFGQVIDSIAYTGRIAIAVAGDRASVSSAISTLAYIAATDTRRQFSYTARGLLASVLDAENALSRYTYNAFGERTRDEQAVGTTAALTIDSSYDRRGSLKTRTDAVGTTEQRLLSWNYDAFGRILTAIDARNSTTTSTYDRLGRQLTRSQSVGGRTETWSTAYDAFDRVSATDATGQTTTYAYVVGTRALTVTTPEGVSVTTTHNRHGQTASVKQTLPTGATAETTYAYDDDGRLVTTTDALGNVATNEYDARGLLSATLDASGRRVELRYDAVGRVLQRIVDPAGLALTTRYRYDGQGRQLTVTDASNRVTGYSYDREGRLTQVALDPAGLNLRTTYTYDAKGRQVTVTDATDRVEQYTYDALGRRTVEQINPAGGNFTTHYAYDANDNVIRRTDASGQVTRFYYDEANRLTHTVDPLGGMTRQWFDKAGRVVAVRSFVQRTNAATLTDSTSITDLDDRLVWNSADEVEYRVYDQDGRLRFVLGGGGSVQEMLYDSASRLASTRRFAAKISLAEPLLSKLLNGAAPGDITVTSNDALDQRTWQVYDAAGQVRFTVDALGNTREMFYDAAGRQVGTRGYARPIALDSALKTKLQAGTATVTDLATKVGGIDDDALDLRTYQVFDAAGRVRLTIDAFGGVREAVSDAAGRTVLTRAYATPTTITPALLDKLKAGTAKVSDVVLTPADTRDYRTYQVFDAVGRLTAVVDTNGFVRQLTYDDAGRLTGERAYAQAATISPELRGKLLAGTATPAMVLTVTPANDATDRVTTYVYKWSGELRYILTRDSATTVTVSGLSFDAMGRKIAEIVYGVTLASSTPATISDITAAITAAGGATAANQRQTRFVYDAGGQLRFTLDNTGAVLEQRYDGVGRVVESRQYGQVVSVASATETNVAAAVAGITDVRTTATTYNAAGEVTAITDALSQTESYAYNGLGQRTQFTDKLGKIWTYGYDAAGRRVSETSPAVKVATTDAAGDVTITSRSILTTTTYDALGNVTSRTENANATDINDRRTTQYVYDNRGHQIRTTFPDAGRINEGTGQIDATGITPSIVITYDALGRATVQKDVRDKSSYKVYDALGRVAYEVDQEGYVTGYTYNGFGEQAGLRRYATKLNTTVLSGWSAGQTLTLAHLQTAGALTSGASDRTLTTTFDTRGQKLSIVQASVTYYMADGTSTSTGTPTTQFVYNTYGDLVKEAVLLEGVAGQAGAQWAETFRYYDALGRNDLTVDAEGHVTQTVFNALGEATETTEFARGLTAALTTTLRPGLPASGDAATGYNRTTRWTYDALGRKASEIVVRRYQSADGSAGVRDVETTFAYDAANRVTGVTTDAGSTNANTTTTTYDALGRATAVREPVQTALGINPDGPLQAATTNTLATAGLYQRVSPFTTMDYDAFGNAVQVRRYAKGWVEGAATAVAGSDQIQVTRYDHQGRAVWELDAAGHVVTREYDAADNVTSVSYRLDGNDGRYAKIKVVSTYDGVGHQISSQVLRDQFDGTTWKPTTADSSEAVAYNAFGDITAKAATLADLGNAAKSVRFEYNNAGQLSRSNADTGTYRRYGYNLAGFQVREERDWTEGTSLKTAVYRNTVDKLGRVVAMVLPSHTADATATSTITQRVDRWGNVVQVIDARGYQVDYQYNAFNQVVHERRPTVRVVDHTGDDSWMRPTNEWFYDIFGRLVGTRDANGHLRSNQYDEAGRLVVAKDALGNATRYAYDVLGNQRFVENALGYITFKQYDLLNHVTAIGDYLPTSAGNARSEAFLQQYVLNQNGDRLSVTDALSFTAKYDYDSQSHLLRSQSAMGVVADYSYDTAGRKIREGNGLTATSGTVADREGEVVRLNELTWDYDVFGRLQDHNNLSGRDSTYLYDGNSGALIDESADGAGIAYAQKKISYYANGRVRSIVETGTANTFRYEYDAAGNRTLEETLFKDANGQTTHTITRTYYDSNNRIERVTQDDVTASKRVFDLTYEYDAVGNRRHVVARSGYGPNVEAVPVDNTAPVVVQTVLDRTVRKGYSVEFRLLFSDIFRDAEQDALTLDIRLANGDGLPSWLEAEFDTATREIVFKAAPAANAANQDLTIRLTATESANLSNTVSTTFAVHVRDNTGPVALAGDTGLKAKTNQAWNRELAAATWFSDADVGDSLSLSVDNVATLPAWLTVDTSNPSAVHLSGTPTTTSSFSLTLRATDEEGDSVTKTFQISTAPNAAPQLVVSSLVPQEAILGRDFDWTRNLAQIFKDNDGDALQVTANGMPQWMSFQYLTDQATPQLKLTGHVPDTVVDGTAYTITLTATDPDNASKSIVLSVTARNNRAPVVQKPSGWTAPALRVNDDYLVTRPISDFFIDPENDQIFIDPIWPAGSSLPEWLKVTVDHENGTISFHGKPESNALAGTFSFQLRSRDGEGLSSIANASITIGTDNPPVRNTAVALSDRTINIGRDFSFTLPANIFTDSDAGDQISIDPSVVVQEHEQEPGGNGTTLHFYWITSKNLPTWLHYDDQTRTFYGTVPAGESPSAINIRLTARDGRRSNVLTDYEQQHVGASDIASDSDFVLNLVQFVSAPPTYTAGSLPGRTIKHGVAVDFLLPEGAFVEPDGDDLTYSAEVLVGSNWVNISQLGLTINSQTGRITGTAVNLFQASYSARIIARDPETLSATGTFTFTVTNTPPTASAIPIQTVGRNLTANLNLAPYFSDVNQSQNTLTFTPVSGLPTGLTLNSNGTITGSTAVALGNYSVRVKASDARGGSVEATFTLTVANNPPVPVANSNQTAIAGTNWSYIVKAFTDPNGDGLTYTVSGRPGWMTWNEGTRTLGGIPGAIGSWTITVTASDGTTSVNTSFTVTTPNAEPTVQTAIPTQSVPRNTTWSFTVPPNTFKDANGDPLSYSVTSVLPTGVTFSNGTFGGKPTVLGNHSITVLASDGNGGSRSHIFTLSVTNTPPAYTPGSLPSRVAQTGATVTWPLPAGSFTDANSDPLGYSLYVLVPEHEVWFWNAQDQAPDMRTEPAKWVLASDVGLSIAGNGTISGNIRALSIAQVEGDDYPYYVPNRIDYTYQLKIVASDPSAATASGTFSATVNIAPTAPSLPNKTIKSGLAWTFDFNAFTDGNGDTLTYTVTGLPTGLSHTTGTGTRISGTPTVAGTYTVTVKADDKKGGITTATFTITVQANTAPVAPSISDQIATKGAAWSIALPVFTDANNDPLTYTATNLPPGLSFATGTRVISGTPTTTGVWTVTYTAKDGRGGETNKTFKITVNASPPSNRAPVVSNPLQDQYALGGEYFEYIFPANTFSDPDGNPLTYTASLSSGAALPGWLYFDKDNRKFYGTPGEVSTMAWDIRVTATDPSGLNVSDVFNLVKEGTGGGGGGGGGTEPLMAGTYTFDVGTEEGGTEAMAGTQSLIIPEVTDRWFTYDAENRIKVNNGKLSGGQIIVDAGDSTSFELMYDAAGHEVARFHYYTGGGYVYRTAYDLRGRKTLEFHPEAVGGTSKGVSKRYEYNATGQLLETRSYFANDRTEQGRYDVDAQQYVIIQLGGWLSGAETSTYDADGRLRTQTTLARPSVDWWLDLGDRWEEGTSTANQYTDLGVLNVTSLLDYTLSDGTHAWADPNRADNASGYDAAGRLGTYRYSAIGSGGWYTHTYTSTYQGWESYQEKTVSGASTNTNFKPTTNTLTYDGFGRLTTQNEHTNYQTAIADRRRYYAYNGDGAVQLRREGTINTSTGAFGQTAGSNGAKPNYLFVHASGQQQAELAEGGSIRTWNGGSYHTPQLQGLNGAGRYDAGGGKVVVQAGEKLADIAQRIYGTPQLWYVLAEANGLSSSTDEPIAGTSLNAPSVKVNSNDATTFKPYNPGEAVGPTSPGLPYITPPPKNQCSTLALILIVVVVVAVTVFTAGAATAAIAQGGASALASVATATTVAGAVTTTTTLTALGAITVGAAAGAAGALAGQALGSAMGVSSFSWRNVAAGAITGAITGGLAQGIGSVGGAMAQGGAAGFGKAAALAVANAGANYAGQKIAGVDVSFNWNSIAASAVSSLVAAKVAPKVVDKLGLETDFANRFTYGTAGGMVSLAVRSSFGQTLHRSDYATVFADAFGNALGNAAVRGIGTLALRRQTSRMLEQMSPEQRQQLLMMNFNDPNTSSDHTRRASDEELYASQADIDALKAQGRDVTAAQKALDELWTRRYAGDDIPTLETVTAVVPEGYDGNGENAFDGALIGLRSWMGSVRADSRSIVDNADSPAMAAVGSGLYAINSVTDAVVSGFVDTGRLFTSSQQRGQFATGMKSMLTTNPLTTAGNAWGAWSNLPTEDRLRFGAAAIASLGAAPLSRAKDLGDVAPSNAIDVANNPATITAYRVEGNIAPNHRLLISETGEVSLVPGNENVVWLNFGQESRAMSYLQRKIDAGLPGAQLKSFEVDASLVERLRVEAVPERLARMNPNKPIISADPYPDQFGLPKSYFEDLLNSVKQGTGKNGH